MDNSTSHYDVICASIGCDNRIGGCRCPASDKEKRKSPDKFCEECQKYREAIKRTIEETRPIEGVDIRKLVEEAIDQYWRKRLEKK